jgi:glycosyltransferase involved in cell wall biosynthesis
VDAATLEAVAPEGREYHGKAPAVLFTGRLVAIKNVEMLIHSAALARDCGVHFRLRIVGDGPERSALEALVIRLDLAPRVDFAGAVSRSRVFDELRQAEVYAFPSLKEGGPWSLMEAMCAGLPVICLDTSGMSVLTDESTAIRIAPTSREAIIRGMAEGLAALCASRELRARLGQAGRARMRDVFLWDRKGEELARILFGNDLVAETAESRPRIDG